MKFLKSLLSHPMTKGMDLDDPQTTELRKKIISGKPFLKNVYRQWYSLLIKNLPDGNKPVLELGSGAGFLEKHLPGLITSDILPVKGCDMTCNATELPLQDSSIRAVVMINVLHHIEDPVMFLHEASRCIDRGGKIILIEPWQSAWSEFVYTKLHHEPFDPDQVSWKLPPSGPLSGGNDALPWIIFKRDLDRFRQEHPSWQIQSIEPGFPVSYLLSGGISMRSLLPGWMFAIINNIEKHLPARIIKKTAMFSLIVLKKN